MPGEKPAESVRPRVVARRRRRCATPGPPSPPLDRLPDGESYEKKFESSNSIDIYRLCLPTERGGPLGYLLEYPLRLPSRFLLSLKIFFQKGFDVVHALQFRPDPLFLSS